MITTITRLPRWQLAILGLFAVLGLGVVYWLISPLFINVAVNESLPGLETQINPSASGRTSSQSANTMTKSVDTVRKPNAASGLMVLGSGAFYNVAHDGSGTATIFKQADGAYILRLSNFKVLNGPDLFVYASSVARPNERNVNDGNSINLGRLKGNVGDQNYLIPAGTPLEQLRSIVIWCRAFSVNFASAAIRP